MRTTSPPSDPSALTLQAGDLHLQLNPDPGGAVTGLWLAGQPLLQPGAAAALVQAPLAGVCAPAGFDWKGRHYSAAADHAVATQSSGAWNRRNRMMAEAPSHAKVPAASNLFSQADRRSARSCRRW